MADPSAVYGPSSSVVITGASSGIGAALACNIARYGANIALVARRRERLEEVAVAVSRAGGKPLVVPCDVTDVASVARAAAAIREEQGAPTVAILNAGVGGRGVTLEDFDGEQARRTFDINVYGVINWLEHVLPPMVERRSGIIVGISSIAGMRGLPRSAVYSASKSAVSKLLEALRLEGRDHGVQISIVEPGFIKSELTARNEFRMPFILETDDAAERIAAAVADGSGWVRFPWPLVLAMKLVRALPQPLYERMHPLLTRAQGRS
ncbi:MAG: SDR family NAD(P)-dependent oxidoreductase [Myxococcales bacterium]|nr:SDR family NAD(P)-dependent oxidoreductase [Myxococcales bacterium]